MPQLPIADDQPDQTPAITPTPQPGGMTGDLQGMLGVDPQVQALLGQTPADYIKQRIYGAANPNKKQKAVGLLKSLFAGLSGGPNPQNQALREYNLQTGRLAQDVGQERAQGALTAAALRAMWEQDRVRMMQENNAEKNAIGRQLAGVRQQLAQTLAAKQQTQAAHLKALEDLQNKKIDLGTYVALENTFAKNPIRQAEYLNNQDPNIAQKILQTEAQQGLAQNAGKIAALSTGSNTIHTQANDANGNPVNVSQRQRVMGGQNLLQQLLAPMRGAAPMMSAPGTPAPAVNPGGGPGTGAAIPPRTVPANPGIPSVGGAGPMPLSEAMQKYQDPLTDFPANDPLLVKAIPDVKSRNQVIAERNKRQGEMTEDANNLILGYYPKAVSAVQGALNLIRNHQDNKVFGTLAGSQLAKELTGRFGSISPEDMLEQALRPDVVMSKVRSNVGGRMAFPEIKMQDLGIRGKMTDAPENVIAAYLTQALQTNGMYHLLRGDIKPEQWGKATNAQLGEVRRMLQNIRDFKAGKAQLSDPEMDVTKLMQQRSDAGRQLRNGARRKATIISVQ